jgi:predicted dehydrogenase
VDVTHAVDLLVWMGGGTDGLDSRPGHLFPDTEYCDPTHANAHTATVRFQNGGLGVPNSNRTAGGRASEFEMYGEGVSADPAPHHEAADRHDRVVYSDGTPVKDGERLTVDDVADTGVPPGINDATYRLTRPFVDCVAGGAEPRPNLCEAAETMAAVETLLLADRDPSAVE